MSSSISIWEASVGRSGGSDGILEDGSSAGGGDVAMLVVSG